RLLVGEEPSRAGTTTNGASRQMSKWLEQQWVAFAGPLVPRSCKGTTERRPTGDPREATDRRRIARLAHGKYCTTSASGATHQSSCATPDAVPERNGADGAKEWRRR